MVQLLNSFLIIFASLTTGYVIQFSARKGYLKLPFSLEKTRKNLQKIGLLFLMPVAFAGVYWAMDFHQFKMLLFPFLGTFNLIMSGVIAIFISGLLQMNNRDAGAFFCCGFFSNYINIGGLICFIFYGEEGYKLVLLYALFVRVLYYILGFPVAKYFALKGNKKGDRTFNFKTVMKDPFVVVGLGSVIIGFCLNAIGLARPPIYSLIISIFVPLNTTVLLISVGLSIKFSKIKEHIKEALMIDGLKYIIIPIVMTSIGFLLGYHQIDNALPLKVILIVSSSPAAFVALVPPSQYGLNLDLANSCWIFNTVSLAFFLPVLFMIIKIL